MKGWIFITGILFSLGASAQTISGRVVNENNEPLIGASVYWVGTTIGISAGNKGRFELDSSNIGDKRLIAKFVGYQPDTIEITHQLFVEFSLRQAGTLGEVTVTSERPGIIISDRMPVKTEQITKVELRKAACCDLAGCFETQATVQPQTTNVVTNSKELRILGLSGVYNQVLIDGMPMIQGLSYTYGISSIPGTLVDNIYVSKGANSVLQGYESISGQINVETKEPDETDRLLLNVYTNSFLEKQFNTNYTVKKGKWSDLITAHSTQPADRTDQDNDGFMDVPLLTRYMIFNKWKYGNDQEWGWSSRIGMRYLHEQRIGGQTAFDPENDEGRTSVYGQLVKFNQAEVWSKTGYRFNDKHQLVLFASGFHHKQHAFFGTVDYAARQTNVYTNLQHELDYSVHDLKTGVSFRYVNLNEDIAFADTSLQRTYAGHYPKQETIPGIFAENTMRFFNDKLTWIAGIRADHHDVFGIMVTPRTLVKYQLAPKTTMRINIGTGWRTVNLFSENINLLVSSRDIVFAEQLNPEKAVNYGINVIKKFETNSENLSGYVSVDFYRTDFQNQIFPDYNSDPTKAIIENFTGTSVSNSFQAEVFLKIWRRLEFKAGYSNLDVYRNIDGQKQVLPFNPKHKVLATFSYQPLTDKLQFDVNVHWYGEQRLPDTRSNPPEFRRPDFSKPYAIVNTQFTYNFGRFEGYAGCENIFDFRQTQPILGWQDPFGRYFDTSSVWGPTRGREVYVGMRFRLSMQQSVE